MLLEQVEGLHRIHIGLRRRILPHSHRLYRTVVEVSNRLRLRGWILLLLTTRGEPTTPPGFHGEVPEEAVRREAVVVVVVDRPVVQEEDRRGRDQIQIQVADDHVADLQGPRLAARGEEAEDHQVIRILNRITRLRQDRWTRKGRKRIRPR